MASTKLVGYILSGIGLALIVLSNTLAKLSFMAKLGTKAVLYPVVGAIILIVVGIVLVMSDSDSTSKVKHAAPEVPIYEGVGKKRRIIGYQKAND
jgi:hypothetical protein